MRLWTIAITAFFAFSLPAAAQQAKDLALSSTSTGRRVELYLTAFNSGQDSVMRAFFLTNVAKDALERIPLEERMGRYRQLRGTAQQLTLRKVLLLQDDRVNIVVETRAGLLAKLEFEFEQSPPHGLIVIGMSQPRRDEQGVTPAKDDTALVKAAEEYVGQLARNDDFSGVVLIARYGIPVFQKAYGLADKENNIPNTLTTRFNLGSMNKSFTAVAIHQLAQQGKLSLDDTLKKFLPDYPNREAAEKVTIRHLLEMKSGIGDFFGERYNATPKEKLKSIADYLPLFADKPLAFEPGTRRQYSNGGYIVLGAIIERVSGMDYYRYVRNNLFIPARMTETDSYDKDSPAIARGYRGAHGEKGSNVEVLPQRGSSAGGGYSTAGDLLRYTLALDKGSIVPVTYEGRRGLGIAGGMEGVNAALEWDPASGYAIVVLSNYDPPTAEKVAQRLRALLPSP